MKRLYFLYIYLLFAVTSSASDIQVKISDGVDSEGLKTKMEIATSRILNEVNDAQAQNRDLNFHTMGVNESVSRSMAMLWENTPFVCSDELIVEHCITTKSGYQIRNIPLLMKPRGDREFNEDEYQEAVISFDKNGNVESFYLTISQALYMNVIKDNKEVTDLRRRQLILDYVEQFRTAYNQRDINFLNQVFSDDALIITGKVIIQKHQEGFNTQKIQYNKQTKEEYIAKLRGIFKSVSYIKVTFDEIEVMRHPANKDFYGVTLHQGWRTSTYGDDGYLFLLWDFTNEDAPQIHVRTWQPDRINGKTLPKDEIFSLSDFDI